MAAPAFSSGMEMVEGTKRNDHCMGGDHRGSSFSGRAWNNGSLFVEIVPGGRVVDNIDFSYKGAVLQVSESFIYLGVLFDAVCDAGMAWEFREGLGWKALGAVKGELRGAPFLPLMRRKEIVEAIVGGGYLYASELWGPFVVLRGSRVNRELRAWLLGFGAARPNRQQGWVPIRDLDVEALSRAVRVLEEVSIEGSTLLTSAVRQLHLNWEGARVGKGSTWFGRLISRVQHVWPRFKLRVASEISWSGAPLLDPAAPLSLAKRFIRDAVDKKWRRRQLDLLLTPPNDKNQDFILLSIIHSHGGTFDGHIFTSHATIGATDFQCLLRLLAGMEDFARTNAHYARRSQYPGLEASHLKRACLSCLIRRRIVVLDSEWHAMCACPVSTAARRRYLTHCNIVYTQRDDCSVDDLASWVLRARGDVRLLDGLGRLAADVVRARRREFSSLASRVLPSVQ